MLFAGSWLRLGSLLGRPRRPGCTDGNSAGDGIRESSPNDVGEVKSKRFEDDADALGGLDSPVFV